MAAAGFSVDRIDKWINSGYLLGLSHGHLCKHAGAGNVHIGVRLNLNNFVSFVVQVNNLTKDAEMQTDCYNY